MIPGAGDLRFDRMPPLRVPLRAFLAAPFLGAAGGAMLAVAGSAAFANRWTGELIGAAHLVTVGFLTLVMVGAILQVLPVVTGVPVPGTRRVGPLTEGTVATGAVIFAAGVGSGTAALSGAGAVLLAVGLGVFVVAGVAATWQTRRNPTGRAMGLSVLSLVAVAGLGVFLLAGHAGWVPLRRDLTDVHLAWALAGWVGLLVMGVSFQVVPMFQVTPNYPRWLEQVLPSVAFAGLALWTAGRLVSIGGLAAVGSLTVAVAFVVYAGATLALQTRRRRKLRDATTDAWRVGMASLTVAAVLMGAQSAGVLTLGDTRTAFVFGVVAVYGFAVSVVEGMLYKIVPFLSWLHLQNIITGEGLVGKVKIRNMRQLLAPPTRQFTAHLVAYGLVLVAAAAGGLWVPAAGLAVAVDFGWLGVALVGVVRRHREDRERVLAATARPGRR